MVGGGKDVSKRLKIKKGENIITFFSEKDCSIL
jgi:hypothetical protein